MKTIRKLEKELAVAQSISDQIRRLRNEEAKRRRERLEKAILRVINLTTVDIEDLQMESLAEEAVTSRWESMLRECESELRHRLSASPRSFFLGNSTTTVH